MAKILYLDSIKDMEPCPIDKSLKDEYGHQVDFVASKTEAEKKLKEKRYDCFLLEILGSRKQKVNSAGKREIVFSEKAGIRLIKRIRKSKVGKLNSNIFIVVVTASRQPCFLKEATREGLENGGDILVFQKPARLALVQAMIKLSLNSNKKQKKERRRK